MVAVCVPAALCSINLFRSWTHESLSRSVPDDLRPVLADFCCSFRCCAALINVPAAFNADVKPEEEEQGQGRKEGREADKAGKRGKDQSYRASQRVNQRGLPSHTHHGLPANQSSCFLDPSSLRQLLIHGSLKQM